MEILKPDLVLDSVLSIDFEKLKKRHIRGLLLDIDNTLVAWKQSQPEREFVEWVQSAQTRGLRLCLVSNALEKRARCFSELLGIPAVGQAWKPLSGAFRRGLSLLRMEAGEVAVVGDQLFTDVFGGNRLRLFTILINPLSSEEFVTTKLMRRLEKIVLARMVRTGKISPHLFDIRYRKKGEDKS